MKYLFGFLVLLLIPFTPLFGANLSAGFAPNSVWVSKNNVTAGKSVNIYTVLYNSSDEPISGDLTFLVDSTAIGTKNFTVSSGETKIESYPWQALVGTHTVG